MLGAALELWWCRLREVWLERCPAENDLVVLADSCASSWPRRPVVSWPASEIMWSAGLEKWLSFCPWPGDIECTSSPVLGFSLEVGCGGARTHSEKSNRAAEGTGKQELWVAAEGTGVILSGEKEGRPHCSIQLPEGRLWRGWCWSLFLKREVTEHVEVALSRSREGLGWISRRIYSQKGC